MMTASATTPRCALRYPRGNSCFEASNESVLPVQSGKVLVVRIITMTSTLQHRSTSSILLVCLLLLAQWTGFATVLCVSGSGHVEVEELNAPCCTPRAPRDAGISGGADGSCVGCTDMPMQTASAWDPSHRQNIDDVLSVICVVSAGDLVRPAASEEALEAGHPPLASSRSIAVAPLRC